MRHKANALLASKVSATEDETNLEAAVRWNHRRIITFYLEKVEWPKEVLERALKLSRREEVRAEIGRRLQPLKGSCWGALFFACRCGKSAKVAGTV